MVDTVSRMFDFYSILYWGGRPPITDRTAAVQVHCFDGGDLVGMLQFFDGRDNVPANQLTGELIVLNYELGRFGDIVGILREESPLMLTVNPGTGAGYLGTFLEPVGMEEDDEEDDDDFDDDEDDSGDAEPEDEEDIEVEIEDALIPDDGEDSKQDAPLKH